MKIVYFSLGLVVIAIFFVFAFYSPPEALPPLQYSDVSGQWLVEIVSKDKSIRKTRYSMTLDAQERTLSGAYGGPNKRKLDKDSRYLVQGRYWNQGSMKQIELTLMTGQFELVKLVGVINDLNTVMTGKMDFNTGSGFNNGFPLRDWTAVRRNKK